MGKARNLANLLADDLVGTSEIANGAVTSDKLGVNAVVAHLGYTPANQSNTYTQAQVDAAVAAAIATAIETATPPGAVVNFAMSTAPSGYLAADGSEVSRTTYAALFAAIGTTWGVGDGSTTFNLPNIVDRMVIGSGNLYALGVTGGSKDAIVVEHTHSITDPGHRHQLRGDSDTAPDGGVSHGTDDGINVAMRLDAMDFATTGITINSTGSSGTDANLPPYIGLLACIKF
jgi:microcystin-dependent protein